MKKLICFGLSAVMMTALLCGCGDKKTSGKNTETTTENASSETTSTETTTEVDMTPLDNLSAPFIGKWETYKVSVSGELYETSYAGYPLSSVAKLVIKPNNTAEYHDNLNPRGKERVINYNWSITSEKSGSDILHLLSPDDRFDLQIEQGEMKMINPDMGEETDIYYLLPVSEFTVIEKTTEAGLDKVNYSKFMGKWEACEVTMGEEVHTDKLGDYPVNASFQLEMTKDRTASMNVLNESLSFEWEPEKKEQLYMWSDMEGFAITLKDGKLILDNENPESPFIIKMKQVNKFTEYDFEAAANNIPDEDIILESDEKTAE